MGGAPALVIEFFGFPGAGKTTLADHLLRHRQNEGCTDGRREAIGRLKGGRAEHYTRLAAFTIAEGRHLATALRLAAAVAPARTIRWQFAAKLATWPYRLSLVHHHHYATVVLDQGPLQSVWCVLLGGELREDRALRAMVHDVVTADHCTFAFIYVDITPEMAADRITARGPMAPPFDHGRTETLRLLAAHRHHFEQIREMAEEQTGRPVFRVDGAAPLELNDAHIAAYVDGLPTLHRGN
jgi:thymidylate kinase